jgi:hypothetical protein
MLARWPLMFGKTNRMKIIEFKIFLLNLIKMTELERIVLELDLKGYKELLDFYRWRSEMEGETTEIMEAIDMLFDLIIEIKNKLDND